MITSTYSIEGMTCNNCRVSVENKLLQIESVMNAKVSLEEKRARLELDKKLDIAILQKSIGSKYKIGSISNKEESNQSKTPSKFRQLSPLFLIVTYILITTLFLNRKEWVTGEMMLDFMGLFFIVFSFFKILDVRGFAQSFAMYDPLAKTFKGYGWIYSFIEVVLGLMFLLRWEIEIALVLTIVILGNTTIGVTKALLNKNRIQCACLGTALNLPMTEATLIENAIMILMAFSMLFIF